MPLRILEIWILGISGLHSRRTRGDRHSSRVEAKNPARDECLSRMQRCIHQKLIQLSSGQSLSHVWLFVTLGLQHARLPCPSPSPRVRSDSCPLTVFLHHYFLFISILYLPYSLWVYWNIPYNCQHCTNSFQNVIGTRLFLFSLQVSTWLSYSIRWDFLSLQPQGKEYLFNYRL